MNLEDIESLLVPALRRQLGRLVDISPGPPSMPALGGMRPVVFVHASGFDDRGGLTHEGARIARRPVREGRYKGYAEERPALVTIEVTCIALRYASAQSLAGQITPLVLRTLASKAEFGVGGLDNAVRLVFRDCSASLARARVVRLEVDNFACHEARLVFELDGFLHVKVTKRDGLRRKPKLEKDVEKVPRKVTKKKVAKKKAAKKKPRTRRSARKKTR